MPEQRERLPITLTLTPSERALAVLGIVPRQMEDKWFLFVEAGRLLCCRSWTKTTIFDAAIEPTDDGGARLDDVFVNRDPSQYRATDAAGDAEMFQFLVEHVLLDRPRTPTDPANSGQTEQSISMHSHFGRGHVGNGVDS